MTREELEKESIEAAEVEYEYAHERFAFEKGYIAAAEPRERELERLRDEVARMKRPLWILKEEHDAEIERLRACLREFERAIGEHSAPSDCYATGPMTGDTFRDLIQCPACSALAMYRSLMVPPIPLPEDTA